MDDSLFKFLPQKKTCEGKQILGDDGLWRNHFLGYSVKREEGKLVIADASGLVGLSQAQATSPTAAFKACYDYIDKLKISNLQYRTDALECVQEDLRQITKLGYDSYR
jgi:hypothetical protein